MAALAVGFRGLCSGQSLDWPVMVRKPADLKFGHYTILQFAICGHSIPKWCCSCSSVTCLVSGYR
jgi:hypothetical protein